MDKIAEDPEIKTVKTNNLSREDQAVLDELNQVLQPCLESLLKIVEKNDYFNSDIKIFNANKYIAQYLMRNNPKYNHEEGKWSIFYNQNISSVIFINYTDQK